MTMSSKRLSKIFDQILMIKVHSDALFLFLKKQFRSYGHTILKAQISTVNQYMDQSGDHMGSY